MKELDLDKEIVFASSDPDVSHAISRLIKQEKLRKINYVRLLHVSIRPT